MALGNKRHPESEMCWRFEGRTVTHEFRIRMWGLNFLSPLMVEQFKFSMLESSEIGVVGDHWMNRESSEIYPHDV
jgi:hypothetical protein